MNKIIMRTKIVPSISSAIIQESKENETFSELFLRLGKNHALKQIFDEKDVTYDFLFQEYEKVTKGMQSSYFNWMYMVAPKFGVTIDSSIYLYHYDLQTYQSYQQLIPWVYTESKKYLGDTWWMGDEEILSDISSISIIEFLEKYRGY